MKKGSIKGEIIKGVFVKKKIKGLNHNFIKKYTRISIQFVSERLI